MTITGGYFVLLVATPTRECYLTYVLIFPLSGLLKETLETLPGLSWFSHTFLRTFFHIYSRHRLRLWLFLNHRYLFFFIPLYIMQKFYTLRFFYHLLWFLRQDHQFSIGVNSLKTGRMLEWDVLIFRYLSFYPDELLWSQDVS